MKCTDWTKEFAHALKVLATKPKIKPKGGLFDKFKRKGSSWRKRMGKLPKEQRVSS